MEFKVSLCAFVVLVGVLTVAGDQTLIRDSKAFGQCKGIVSSIRTDLQDKVTNVSPDELPNLICDLDDKQLQAQCREVMAENGAEILDFLNVLDEDDLCEQICQEFNLVDTNDFSLYFKPADGATRTDDVGNFLCSMCKRVMTFLHNFLTAKGHEAFVLHMLKGVCHFVPMFRTQCDLLINMYGRLIINLAARYLGPNLCKTFHLCPRMIPELSCAEPEYIDDGYLMFDSLTRGSTVTYSCNEGFRMAQEEATRTCGDDGLWTGKLPVCLKALDME